MYRIACLLDGNKGGIVSGSTRSAVYPIVYDPAATSSVADAFWTITEVGAGSGKYIIQNASTKQYISYVTNYDPKRNLDLVDALNGDTTLFKLTLHSQDGVDYYSISPVVAPGLVFNRRGSDKDNYVGLYSHDGTSTNEQYVFYDATGSVVKDDAVTVVVDEETPLAVYGPLSAYLDEFSLSGKPLVYNKRSGFSPYFFSIPLTLMDNDVDRTVHFTVKNTAYSVLIDGTKVINESDFTFTGVTAGKNFTIKIMNGTKELLSTTMTFTG
ncbi:MAG: hypothetical protein PHH63_04535, partial [Bacteroidales bacterium]|nr:hypothetical protein [Bacteroidales bacterium]